MKCGGHFINNQVSTYEDRTCLNKTMVSFIILVVVFFIVSFVTFSTKHLDFLTEMPGSDWNLHTVSALAQHMNNIYCPQRDVAPLTLSSWMHLSQCELVQTHELLYLNDLMILTPQQWLLWKKACTVDSVFLWHIFNDKLFVRNKQIYFSQSGA